MLKQFLTNINNVDSQQDLIKELIKINQLISRVNVKNGLRANSHLIPINKLKGIVEAGVNRQERPLC